jgi:ABC-type branched-subunit amino acid transport system ATPase component
MAEPILELQEVSKRFGAAPVLDRLSLTLLPGERRGLIGPNGAGKTTLINILTGKLRPDAGRVLYRGADITALPAHRRNRLGMGRSFQILSLFGGATVGENIRNAVLRRRKQHVSPFRRLARLDAVAAETEAVAASVGLHDALAEPVDTLPYGAQRRLDLALVLAQDPDLLILDEPAAGLAAAETRDLVSLLKSIIGRRSLILVEHDMDVVYALSDRITVLDYGRVLTEGTPQAVSADPEVRRIYLGEDAA